MPVYDQVAQDAARDISRAGMSLLTHLMRVSISTGAAKSGLAAAVADFERKVGERAMWTRMYNDADAGKVVDILSRDGVPAAACGRFVIYRCRDCGKVNAAIREMSRDGRAARATVTSRDGSIPALPAAGESGAEWVSHECDEEATAAVIADRLRTRGVDAVARGSEVAIRAEHTDRAIDALVDMGFSEASLDDIASDLEKEFEAELDKDNLEVPATQRQQKFIDDLRAAGAVTQEEYDAFCADPTFKAARELLDRRSGYVAGKGARLDADRRPKGAKDTDRDGISDANEDLDSDGLDYAREEDPRVPATDRDAQTELDRLERKCDEGSKALNGDRGRSEISIPPRSR